MKFEYDDKEFTGLREVVIRDLKAHLNACFLSWRYGAWRLGSSNLGHECGPIEARKVITERIISSVPIECEGKIFESVNELVAYLEDLELMVRNHWFYLGVHSRTFPNTFPVKGIKDLMIQEIVRGVL